MEVVPAADSMEAVHPTTKPPEVVSVVVVP
jgi:hypothetical protein